MLEGTKGERLWLESRLREPRELTLTVLLPSRVADGHAAAGLPLPSRPRVAEGTLKTWAQPQVSGVLRVPPGPGIGEPRSDRRSPATARQPSILFIPRLHSEPSYMLSTTSSS